MSPKWICIILFYRWSSYVISFGLRQYLSFVPYIIEPVPKYLGWRGDSLSFSDLWFFRGWFDFYTNLYKTPNSLRVIHVVSDSCVFCCSVCHMWRCVTPDNFQTSTSGSRRFKSDAPCSSISALLSLHSALIIFSFFIQFTSNRLLLYNSHHIIWAECVPLLLVPYYFV